MNHRSNDRGVEYLCVHKLYGTLVQSVSTGTDNIQFCSQAIEWMINEWNGYYVNINDAGAGLMVI